MFSRSGRGARDKEVRPRDVLAAADGVIARGRIDGFYERQ
jgi:hypothetical protein